MKAQNISIFDLSQCYHKVFGHRSKHIVSYEATLLRLNLTVTLTRYHRSLNFKQYFLAFLIGGAMQ